MHRPRHFLSQTAGCLLYESERLHPTPSGPHRVVSCKEGGVRASGILTTAPHPTPTKERVLPECQDVGAHRFILRSLLLPGSRCLPASPGSTRGRPPTHCAGCHRGRRWPTPHTQTPSAGRGALPRPSLPPLQGQALSGRPQQEVHSFQNTGGANRGPDLPVSGAAEPQTALGSATAPTTWPWGEAPPPQGEPGYRGGRPATGCLGEVCGLGVCSTGSVGTNATGQKSAPEIREENSRKELAI